MPEHILVALGVVLTLLGTAWGAKMTSKEDTYAQHFAYALSLFVLLFVIIPGGTLKGSWVIPSYLIIPLGTVIALLHHQFFWSFISPKK